MLSFLTDKLAQIPYSTAYRSDFEQSFYKQSYFCKGNLHLQKLFTQALATFQLDLTISCKPQKSKFRSLSIKYDSAFTTYYQKTRWHNKMTNIRRDSYHTWHQLISWALLLKIFSLYHKWRYLIIIMLSLILNFLWNFWIINTYIYTKKFKNNFIINDEKLADFYFNHRPHTSIFFFICT